MTYTAILQDSSGHTIVFTFNGTYNKAESFSAFKLAWSDVDSGEGFDLVAIVPGVHEVVCDYGIHSLPRDVINLSKSFSSQTGV